LVNCESNFCSASGANEIVRVSAVSLDALSSVDAEGEREASRSRNAYTLPHRAITISRLFLLSKEEDP